MPDPTSIAELHPDPDNARRHNPRNIGMIERALNEVGAARSIVIDESNTILAGNGVVEAAAQAGIEKVQVVDGDGETLIAVRRTGLTAEQKRRLALYDNRTAELADWNPERLDRIRQESRALLDGMFTDKELDKLLEEVNGRPLRASLADRFLVPPFSVLDARQGYWRERKRAWLALGIQSELGRGNEGDKTTRGLTFSNSAQPVYVYKLKEGYEATLGRKLSWEEFYRAYPDAAAQGGTSIFDPVLCEVAYRWFSPPGGAILDPFAGGSVRGVVAALLGRPYLGVDLSGRQVEANRTQWAAIGPRYPDAPAPGWRIGDSRALNRIVSDSPSDFLFSCPPFYDLETYSDDPADLSNAGTYADFLAAYREIVARAVAHLKSDRFACFVVGAIRDGAGLFHDLPGDTVAAFEAAGARLYNDAVLVTNVGSLAVRAGGHFVRSRKLGRTHQNVLVFVKGDPARAVEACGPVEVELPEPEEEGGEQ